LWALLILELWLQKEDSRHKLRSYEDDLREAGASHQN
jgi:hypothetical protein